MSCATRTPVCVPRSLAGVGVGRLPPEGSMTRRPALSLVFLTCTLISFGLTAAAQASPKIAKGHRVVVPVDDDLMVSDPVNPRILHSKQPGVINRAWVERTAKPRIPAEVLDHVADLFPAPPAVAPVLQSPEGHLFANGAISQSGKVFIIEGDRLVNSSGNGFTFDHNGNGAFDVIQQVLQNFGDQFDFVTVFTTFSDQNVAAYYFPLKNDIDGLGECNFNQGKTFGCLFDQLQGQLQNLQGFVFMNSLSTWQEWDRNYDGVIHPFSSFDSAVFSTLGQEVAHRWGSGLRFVDPRNDNVSNLLLGRDQSHWAAFVDTDASVMDGWDWDDQGNRFELVGDMDRFSTLDLYTIGALPVAAAKPFFVIDNAIFDVGGNDFIGLDGRAVPADAVLQLPSDGLLDANGMNIGATGVKVPVTIQDVVDAEGNRCPDPDFTQKTFRQAVVLVTRPGQTIAQAQPFADDLNVALETWEAWWLDRTNKRLKLCTDLNGPCLHAEQILGGGEVEHDGESLQPGQTGSVTMTVSAKNAKVEGAVLTLEAVGDSAAFITIPSSVEVGNVDVNGTKEVDFDVELAADYPCGTGANIVVTLSSDNAADVVEEVRFFPGYRTIFEETFGSSEHRFAVNADEKDTTSAANKGALAFTETVELTCDMSKRSPERDASPGNNGAFVTGPGTDHVPNLLDNDPGEGAELDGDTSLWSPVFDLEGTALPEIRFAYWFDGEAGDVLKVQLSGDDEKTFQTGKEITESFHGWVVGRISVKDTLGEVPAKVTARFLFEGSGSLEGGIDDVKVLDFDGQCKDVFVGPCGCDQNGETTPAAPVAFVLGLFGLRRLRRRRKA